MVKIAIDAGHAGFGVTPGKRTPAGEFEWTFNNKVVLAAMAELNNYEGVQLLRLDDPTGRRDVPLRERTNKANQWGADLVWSKHFNAITGRWGNHTGTETFTFNGNKSHNAESVRVARVLHQAMLKAWGLRDRGLKTANFHMVREPNCPAVLTEGGFMDSNIDIKIMRDDAKLAEGGREMARALANYYGLKRKDGDRKVEVVLSNNLYRVQVGAFSDRKNAEQLAKELQDKGYPVYIPENGGTTEQPRPTAQPTPAQTPQKTIDQLAQEVLAGKHGTGDARRQSLGNQFSAVQARVNELVGANQPTPKKSIDDVAREIINGQGNWGNNPQRAERLRAAGYDPAEVQRRVNQLI